jgi:hypothetical protein
MTEEEQQRVSGAIAEHLELSNWKIERSPPSQGSAQLYRPPD